MLDAILEKLAVEAKTLAQAAMTAHQAATHEDNKARSKYETLALEASYIAQGQANRAAELAAAVKLYERLEPVPFLAETPISPGALVTFDETGGRIGRVFLGPDQGGLKVTVDGLEVVVITEPSPLGQALLGLTLDEEFVFRGKKCLITSVE
ncbi:transcription elongation factor GreAB [Myxococcota bacterium]|nr:transcription elongation factor GreAB [Myxococcota bacterium]MBU1411856.1 transcription elongation factor GreAB [Myxococcota bacterium]MBU1511089.1 transcription elongation factor GreAB [Myxococcota bacterium]PKN24777.1 MAG: transcription elongation factor GreAB [Deltaproteobacteria bacterium HGW-Deltaproteobacteria-22]